MTRGASQIHRGKPENLKKHNDALLKLTDAIEQLRTEYQKQPCMCNSNVDRRCKTTHLPFLKSSPQ